MGGPTTEDTAQALCSPINRLYATVQDENERGHHTHKRSTVLQWNQVSNDNRCENSNASGSDPLNR